MDFKGHLITSSIIFVAIAGITRYSGLLKLSILQILVSYGYYIFMALLPDLDSMSAYPRRAFYLLSSGVIIVLLLINMKWLAIVTTSLLFIVSLLRHRGFLHQYYFIIPVAVVLYMINTEMLYLISAIFGYITHITIDSKII